MKALGGSARVKAISVRSPILAVAFAVLWVVSSSATRAQTQCVTFSANPIGIENGTSGPSRAANCNDSVRTRVYRPLNSGPSYEIRPSNCDPSTSTCEAWAIVNTVIPGHSQNPTSPPDSLVKTFWLDASSNITGTCGNAGAPLIWGDFDGWMMLSFSCSGGASGTPGQYTYRARISACTIPPIGAFDADTPFILDTPTLTARFCGSPPPPKPSGCNGGAECQECPTGGSGGDPATQASPKASSPGSGGGISIGGGGAGHTPPG